MVEYWLRMGFAAVPYILTGLVTLGVGVLAFRRFYAPQILEALNEATETVKKISSFAGVRSGEARAQQSLERAVSGDVIKATIPEIEALKFFVSEETWAMIEDTIQTNPGAVITLYQKYGHLLQMGDPAKPKETYQF